MNRKTAEEAGKESSSSSIITFIIYSKTSIIINITNEFEF